MQLKMNNIQSYVMGFEKKHLDIRRFISFNYPVLLKEVIVPYPSFTPQRQGFEVHKLIPENLAKNLLQKRQQRTSQPLYLSRTKLKRKKRLIVNECKLERELREKGFSICNPEKLSLKEQVHLFNKHEVIIGTQGSALHGILFDVSPVRNTVCLGRKKAPHSNQLIIDAIKSVNSIYIGALEEDPNCSKTKGWTKNQVLDLDIALDGLRELGLL